MKGNNNMDIADVLAKLIVRFGPMCILTGMVMALMGLYTTIFTISGIGFVLILVGVLFMAILHRKFYNTVW